MRRKLNKLFRALLQDKRYLMLGQSVRDPYGGAAKVTRGISTAFDNQVIDCPISEAAMIGISTGLSMQGFIPITEIMFADFLTLCIDQLFNIAVKMREVHGIDIKMTIRAMEGIKEYGPTHSQNMDWLRVPGVNYFRNDLTAYEPQSINVVIENRNEYEDSNNR
jgi:pyruvate/2-oxoglutarate/acetoin dehydrogenase E1 component